jgi:hypothetical protein
LQACAAFGGLGALEAGPEGAIDGCFGGYKFFKELTSSSSGAAENWAGYLTVAAAAYGDVVGDRTGYDPARDEVVMGGDTLNAILFQGVGSVVDDPIADFVINVFAAAIDIQRVSSIKPDFELSFDVHRKSYQNSIFERLHLGPSP